MTDSVLWGTPQTRAGSAGGRPAGDVGAEAAVPPSPAALAAREFLDAWRKAHWQLVRWDIGRHRSSLRIAVDCATGAAALSARTPLAKLTHAEEGAFHRLMVPKPASPPQRGASEALTAEQAGALWEFAELASAELRTADMAMTEGLGDAHADRRLIALVSFQGEGATSSIHSIGADPAHHPDRGGAFGRGRWNWATGLLAKAAERTGLAEALQGLADGSPPEWRDGGVVNVRLTLPAVATDEGAAIAVERETLLRTVSDEEFLILSMPPERLPEPRKAARGTAAPSP